MTSPSPILAEPTAIPGAQATPARGASSRYESAALAGRAPGEPPTSPGAREEAADHLIALAEARLAGEADDGFVAGVLVALALEDHLAPQEDVWRAFEDLVEAIRLRDGIATGVLHWSEVADDLVCSDPSEAAHHIACGRMDDALRALLGGAR